ncbi:hypothetical protein EVAR_7243_1 [Eumeta japonica]|uniref:Uncharacterized protein n=1 Tax=Eumeta variegata TaxID=151549 RepID=A0A4C1T2E2_EUMVA|nr:hypothetical protein EVAR_7243_1 [Eumeta japonica]
MESWAPPARHHPFGRRNGDRRVPFEGSSGANLCERLIPRDSRCRGDKRKPGRKQSPKAARQWAGAAARPLYDSAFKLRFGARPPRPADAGVADPGLAQRPRAAGCG